MKKNRIIAALAAFTLCLSMAACGNAEAKNSNRENKATTTTTAAETEAPEETGDETTAETTTEPVETAPAETEAAVSETETESTEETTAEEEEPAEIERLSNVGGVMEQLETFLPSIWGMILSPEDSKRPNEAVQLIVDEFEAYRGTVGINDTKDENGTEYSSYSLSTSLNLLGYEFIDVYIKYYETDGIVSVRFSSNQSIPTHEIADYEDIVNTIIDAYGDDVVYEHITDEKTREETYIFKNLPMGRVTVTGKRSHTNTNVLFEAP